MMQGRNIKVNEATGERSGGGRGGGRGGYGGGRGGGRGGELWSLLCCCSASALSINLSA
jgi:hypothetical protein